MAHFPRIHHLPPRLANQIAAGEVVERPASVLKELLENSLDAGAARIRVTFEGGGSRLIRVQDDGCGIHRDDLVLALSRHATSKIERLADLERVNSMGFRGEALASIASVSRCRLVSRTGMDESGWGIEVAGSDVQEEIRPQPHPPGTTVEVRDLFFNTPARRRFLRSERTEQVHLEEVFKRIALSRFDVAFSLHRGTRVLHRLQASETREGEERRLRQLCGKTFLRHAVYTDIEASGLRLRGWLTTPDFSRSQTNLQYFYLNGRIIRDRLVNHAVRQVYQERIHPGRHPAYVLFLEVEPAQVDVNVHPTKHEVRFREARLVHDFLVSGLQKALDGGVPREIWTAPEAGSRSPVSSVATHLKGASWGKTSPLSGAAKVEEQVAVYRRLYAPAKTPPEPARSSGPSGRVVELLHGRYLLAMYSGQPSVIDLQKGRERLFEQRLRDTWPQGVPSRPLLVPVAVRLDEGMRQAVERCVPLLRRAGVEWSPTGPETILIRQLPRMLGGCEVEELIPALLSALVEDGAVDEDRFITLLARHAARTMNQSPSGDELQRVLTQLDALPEGIRRSFRVVLHEADLARLFSSS